jgi:CcmD family protein
MKRMLGSIMMMLLWPRRRSRSSRASSDRRGAGRLHAGHAPMNSQDVIPAPRLVAIAYGFIWVVLFGYLWSVRSRLATVEREIESMSRRVASGQKRP